MKKESQGGSHPREIIFPFVESSSSSNIIIIIVISTIISSTLLGSLCPFS